MNPVTDNTRKGTIGELLVQLRFLEHDVQAAPPIKDSGNDLIAVRAEVFRAIQVKTTTTGKYSKANLPDFYHILAIVELVIHNNNVLLDNSRIFLIPKEKVCDASTKTRNLKDFLMKADHVNDLFVGRK
jgi:hypothetical protein